MNRDVLDKPVRRLLSLVVAGLLVWPAGALVFAQTPPSAAPPDANQPAQLLSPAQLENLVAPVALYPDPLLGQVLAASTYPLEVVEAQQWLGQHQNLHGTQLMDAARQQNWDPSVQALVAFPDVMALMTRDVQWTTDLGNAFLAQQKDVMAAVQRMRLRAERNGRLASTPQQNVTTQTQDGQSAVVIEPAEPQVIYVPVYNPAYIWGPPLYGYYPPLWYPGFGFGFGFGPGIYLGGFFPGWGFGWPGWGLGWGWGCGWFGGGLFVNVGFFNHYGYHGFYGGGFAAAGRMGWQHDPMHRAGVAYGNSAVAARYNNARFAAGRYSAGSSFNGARSSASSGWRSFNNSVSSASRGYNSSSRGGAGYSNPGNSNRGYSAGSQSYGRSYSNSGASRGYSSQSYGRSYSSPSYGSRSYSSPSSGSRGYSAPRSSGGSRSSGGGSRSSGGGGGHGGGRR